MTMAQHFHVSSWQLASVVDAVGGVVVVLDLPFKGRNDRLKVGNYAWEIRNSS